MSFLSCAVNGLEGVQLAKVTDFSLCFYRFSMLSVPPKRVALHVGLGDTKFSTGYYGLCITS
jgi:hypothetical protein